MSFCLGAQIQVSLEIGEIGKVPGVITTNKAESLYQKMDCLQKVQHCRF